MVIDRSPQRARASYLPISTNKGNTTSHPPLGLSMQLPCSRTSAQNIPGEQGWGVLEAQHKRDKTQPPLTSYTTAFTSTAPPFYATRRALVSCVSPQSDPQEGLTYREIGESAVCPRRSTRPIFPASFHLFLKKNGGPAWGTVASAFGSLLCVRETSSALRSANSIDGSPVAGHRGHFGIMDLGNLRWKHLNSPFHGNFPKAWARIPIKAVRGQSPRLLHSSDFGSSEESSRMSTVHLGDETS